MCCWETNRSQKDKGTTAAGQARFEGLCLPVPGRTQTDTERHKETQTDTDTDTDLMRNVLRIRATN